MRAFALFVMILGISQTVFSQPNPFEPFVGDYTVRAAICYRNGVEYVDGCTPDTVSLRNSSPDVYELVETLAPPYASLSQMMEERRIQTPSLEVDARFSSVSKRNAKWSSVLIDSAAKRDARVSVEVESSRDGLELTFHRAESAGSRRLTETRSYFLEALP